MSTARGSWRYRHGARWYDVLSGEWPVYRVGRVAAVEPLELSPGHRVLDLCCGTGLNLPLLRERVGATGSIVGVDASPQMLGRARARVARAGWGNVELLQGDIGDLRSVLGAREGFDAVIATYALSIVPDVEQVWRELSAVLRPEGLVAVADLGLPAGRARWLRPLARVACWGGGADPRRAPWRLVERDLRVTRAASHRAGHVVVRAGRSSRRHDG